MRTWVSISLSCLIFAMAIQVILLPVSSDASDLQVCYYELCGTCSKAEHIVKRVVKHFVRKDRGLGAGLIRMFFHDCFVRGCDASVLLDNSTSNPNTEKNAIPSNPSLRGFKVIDAAKDALEKECPDQVSCADIIAFAARDAAYILGDISYDIPSGSWALYDRFGGMDKTFGMSLRTDWQVNGIPDGVVPKDNVTPNNLDWQYYNNVKSLKTLFFSDWSLLTSPETRKLVEDYSTTPGLFQSSFGQSMVKMGNIGVLNKNNGQIRRSSCSAVNYY